MSLRDYANRPVPPPAMDPPEQYQWLKDELASAFRDQSNLLQILTNVTSIVDQLVTRYSGISPLMVSRAVFSGNYDELYATLQTRYGAAGEPQVTDPTSGQGCGLLTALANALGCAGGDCRGQFVSIGQQVLGRLTGR